MASNNSKPTEEKELLKAKQGIKSTKRVKEFGEVFTPDSIVCDMLKLVTDEFSKQEMDTSTYIGQTFLEPACGDGQFLVRVLSDKMEKIRDDADMTQEQKTYALIKSVSAIYGVDIQEDNVIQSRERVLSVALGKPVDTFDLNNKTNVIQIDLGIEYTEELKSTLEVIINHNIICGNTLNPDNEMRVYEYKFSGDNTSCEICSYFFNDIKKPEDQGVNYTVNPIKIGSTLEDEIEKARNSFSGVADTGDYDF